MMKKMDEMEGMNNSLKLRLKVMDDQNNILKSKMKTMEN